jgi:glycine/D-amino acid oxidase-like deaminating enzyme
MTDTTSQTVPTTAKCVIIGAGIVGNCLVGHLSRLGWTDMVQIDKGPLPNPGGSTGHASNFIFPTDHNKEMAFLTLESQQQYIDHGLNNTVRRYRGRRKPERHGGVQTAHDVGQGVGHRLQARDAGRDQRARPVHQRGDPARWLLHAERVVVDSLETGTQMRNEAGRCRRAAGVRETPRCSTSRPRTARAAEGRQRS